MIADEVLPIRVATFARRYKLNRREEEVLALIVSGVAPKAVGSKLGCAHATVRTHLVRIFSKLDCSGACEVLIKFFSEESF